jgi:hypothetical protein
MNENENNFEPLRRLLALKRHETPPPGYFENFSSEVTARIRAGEGRAAARQAVELPWLFRLLAAFEAKPAFAGGFASVLCLLLLFGIVYAERPDVTMQPLLPVTATGSSLAVATPAGLDSQPMMAQPAEQTIFASSTNPVFNSQSASTLFASQGSQGATVQRIPYILPGN